MKTKIRTWLVLAVVAAGVSCSMNAMAFAQTGQPTGQGTATMPESVVTEDENAGQAGDVGQEGGSPFSVPGNGELLDNKANDDTKQFLTIQTKNGNTFFLVMDHSSDTENVYMLSMIDENDLSEFMEEKEQPSIVLPEAETTPATGSQETTDKEEKGTNGNHKGVILAIVLLMASAVGIGYYFKVAKPRKAEEQAEDEGLEFYDEERSHVDQDGSDEPDEGELESS